MIGKGKGIGKKGKGISKCKKISPTDQVILQSQVVVETKKEVIDLISPAQSPGIMKVDQQFMLYYINAWTDCEYKLRVDFCQSCF